MQIYIPRDNYYESYDSSTCNYNRCISLACSPSTTIVLCLSCSQFNILIDDFNVNWLDESNRRPLYNLFVNCNNYRQLISTYTTDNQTTIDHVYTNLPESQANAHILETYFSDHKPICALINCFHWENS